MSHGYQAVRDEEADDFFEAGDDGGFEAYERARRRKYIGLGALLLLGLVAVGVYVIHRGVSDQAAQATRDDGTNSSDASQPAAPTALGPGKVRGVNIGGWLVLEPWIRPSLFEQFEAADQVKDEHGFCSKLGKDMAKRQLEAHWDAWFKEEDVRLLASTGITHVRIPVGYWIVGVEANEPWIDGGELYLRRSMAWLRKHNVKAVLDLHCAPGSQNGFDNSGVMGAVHWGDEGADGKHPNVDRTIEVLRKLAVLAAGPEYADVVVGLEFVNEPFITLPLDLVKDFYARAYTTIRDVNPSVALLASDSFRFGDMNSAMLPPTYKDVFVDTHIYQVFDEPRLRMTQQEHIDQTCNVNKPQLSASRMTPIVGEWSLATTDCAQWLNGYGSGARYEGKFAGVPEIGSCEGLDNEYSVRYTDEYKAFLKRFAEMQMDAYEVGKGWFFWNFKTERAPDCRCYAQWNYLLGIQQGWMPADLNKRTYSCPPH